MKALAVDNEPEPFWTGNDQADRIEVWKAARDWRDEWGTIEPPPGLNGPSGQQVEERFLSRFDLGRSEVWITDCLNTYRASVQMRAAIDEVYQPFAKAHGLPDADLEAHPSESQIVTEAAMNHLDRLRGELAMATPELVVTLGNAALRVFRALLDSPIGPRKLSADGTYGTPLDVTASGAVLRWFPLAHPAAPAVYQRAHQAWAGPAKA